MKRSREGNRFKKKRRTSMEKKGKIVRRKND